MNRLSLFVCVVLSVFALSCSSSTEPKHNVRGTLVTSNTQQPLEGVIVILESQQDTIVTGANGSFEFSTEGGDSESILITGVGVTVDSRTSTAGAGQHDFGKIEVTLHAKLAAYYPLDGNLNSSNGSDNGALSPEATPSNDRFNLPGRSVSFAAANALGTIPHSQTFSFSSTEGFTISCWVRTPELPRVHPGVYYPVVAKGPRPLQPGSLGFQLATYVSSSVSQDFLLRTNEGFESENRLLLDSETTWHHIVVIVDSKQRIVRIFQDGAPGEAKFPGEDDTSDGNCNNSDPIILGGEIEGTRFPGEIDDLRIYHGALNQQDVQDLYHERGF